MAANRRRLRLEGRRFKAWCHQGLFSLESLLKCTLTVVICLHNINSSVRCTIDGLCICLTCDIFGMSAINKDPPGPGGNLYFKKRKPKRVPEWCRRLGDVSFQFPFNEKFHRGTFRFFFAESSQEPRSESLGVILTFQTSSSLYLSLACYRTFIIHLLCENIYWFRFGN